MKQAKARWNYAFAPVTSWIFGTILSFHPALPVTARMTLPSWNRMKRGVADGRALPSSVARKAARIGRAGAGQLSSFRTRSALAGWTTT